MGFLEEESEVSEKGCRCESSSDGSVELEDACCEGVLAELVPVVREEA